jgi:2-polyprenyl-3-methyl-5-hydroxy-6-metoxy-1,4-benzoquinol methylase
VREFHTLSDPSPDTGPRTLGLLRSAGRYNGWIFRTIRPYLGREILEVGSGFGTMTRWLAGLGHVTASDVSDECLAELRRGFEECPSVRIRALDLRKHIPDERGRYDTVVCLNVLEHVEDDLLALKNLHGFLAPGGRLVLYVPAGRRIFSALDRGVGHYRRYEKEELVRKLRSARFRVSHARYHNPLGALGWWIRGKAFGSRRIARSDVGAFEFLMPLMGIQELFESRFSLSLLAIGEKD